MPGDPARFPLGATVTVEQLDSDPYPVLAALRADEPVSWLPALDGWLVTSRDLVAEALRDDRALTVDDPRFTTAAVLGPSMLSLDGPAHRRRRDPFAEVFRMPSVRHHLGGFVRDEATRLASAAGESLDTNGIEMRSAIAAPLAAATITRMLNLDAVTTVDVLAWYRSIVAAVTELTEGRPDPGDGDAAVQQLKAAVARSVSPAMPLGRVLAQGDLTVSELASDVGVVLFGAIETTEGMIANAFWHLFSEMDAWERLRSDRSMLPAVVEESLRLEPAAAVVDRYTTERRPLGGVDVPAGDLVTLSLLAANRDPSHFDQPDTFNPTRSDTPSHLAFVHGPHGCIGAGLARMETVAAIDAILDLEQSLGLTLAMDHSASSGPSGLVFRKAQAVMLTAAARQGSNREWIPANT